MQVLTSCFRGLRAWAAPCSRARSLSDFDRVAEGQCGRQQVLSGRSSLTTPWSLCQPNPSSHACSNPKLQVTWAVVFEIVGEGLLWRARREQRCRQGEIKNTN